MKTTKKYLKTLGMFVVIFIHFLSISSSILFGVFGFIGMFVSEELVVVFLFILVSIILGFISALLNDLIEWLDKKFRPY